MKKIEYVQHSGDLYSGPAVRLGAGVQVEEAYQAARAYNGVVVGGDCATVGVVGGYLQGNDSPAELAAHFPVFACCMDVQRANA